MKNILLIAQSTFKGIIKDKVFFGIIFCAVLFFTGIYFISSLTLGNDLKVIKDLGLAGIFLFANITAIFFGCTRISQELRDKTYLLVISHPVKTLEFIIGKFFGLLLGAITTAAIMQILYFAILGLNKTIDFLSLMQLLLLFFEITIVLSASMVLSITTSDISSLLLSIAIFYIGHSLVFVKNAFSHGNMFSKSIISILYYLLPNLEKFNIRNSISYNITPTSGQIIYPALYSILYTMILLWLSNLALKKSQEN